MQVDQFRGTISASSSLTLSDAAQNFYKSGNYYPYLRAGVAFVAIVSGEGVGQYRKVVSITPDGQTLTIDHPWDVQPQIGSNYSTFDWSASQWIIANNTLINNFKGIEFFNASATDVLIQANTLTNSSGIMISPTQQAPDGFSVAWGIDIVGNTISDIAGSRPAYIAIVPREDGQTTSFGTSILGIQIRGNNVIAHVPNTFVTRTDWDDSKARVEGYNCYWQWQTSWTGYEPTNVPPPILGTLLQSNLAQNSETAIYLNTGDSQTVFDDTIVRGVTNLSSDNVIAGANRSSEGTMLTDFLKVISINNADQDAAWIEAARSTSTGNTVLMGLNQALEKGGTSATSTQMGGFADTFSLLGRQMHGDIDAVVHVSVERNLPASTTGLLTIRNLATSASPFISIGKTASGDIALQFRSTIGGPTRETTISSTSQWIKLAKRGMLFQAFQSQDGTIWSKVGETLLPFTTRLYYVGLSDISDGTQAGIMAQFDNLSILPINSSYP